MDTFSVLYGQADKLNADVVLSKKIMLNGEDLSQKNKNMSEELETLKHEITSLKSHLKELNDKLNDIETTE